MNILNPGGDLLSPQISPQNKQIAKVIPGKASTGQRPHVQSLNGVMQHGSDASTRNDTYNSKSQLNHVSQSMHEYQPEDNSFAQYRQQRPPLVATDSRQKDEYMAQFAAPEKSPVPF